MLVQTLLLSFTIVVAIAVFIVQWCMCPCMMHMHVCTIPYRTKLLHPVLSSLAIVPAADQSPEFAQVKRQPLQVCCVTVLVMLCRLQRACKEQ